MSTPAERADRAESALAREKMQQSQMRHTGGALMGAAAVIGGTRLLTTVVPAAAPYATALSAASALGGAYAATRPRQKHMGIALGVMVAGATPIINWGFDQAFATISKLTGK